MGTRIGFSTSSSWISRVIRWFTDSKVSHCFIVYYDEEWQRDMVMESEGGLGGAVRLVPFNPHSASIVKIVSPRHSIEFGMRRMVDRLGHMYDYQGLVGMAWVEVGKWLRRKWRNPWQSGKALFCSELVAQVMVDSSYPGTQGWDPGSMDPQMLVDFFDKEASK